MHGAWCWDLLVPELERLGHRAVTVNLPASDASAGCAEYARVAAAAFDGCPDDMVVVGHSMGGLTIPVIATLRPVGRLVFLCAILPQPGLSYVEQITAEPQQQHPAAMGARTVDPRTGTHSRTPEQSIEVFFHDVPEDRARWAVSMLRAQAQTPMTEVSPLRAWPDVESSYVLAADDRCLSAEWLRDNVPSRLGTRPVEIPGSHSPFLGRPAELAAVLHRIAGGG
jgi:pimeloyl-ACP methyl ester carboxylesterase